jgi:hypothetical protein
MKTVFFLFAFLAITASREFPLRARPAGDPVAVFTARLDHLSVQLDLFETYRSINSHFLTNNDSPIYMLHVYTDVT